MSRHGVRIKWRGSSGSTACTEVSGRSCCGHFRHYLALLIYPTDRTKAIHRPDFGVSQRLSRGGLAPLASFEIMSRRNGNILDESRTLLFRGRTLPFDAS